MKERKCNYCGKPIKKIICCRDRFLFLTQWTKHPLYAKIPECSVGGMGELKTCNRLNPVIKQTQMV